MNIYRDADARNMDAATHSMHKKNKIKIVITRWWVGNMVRTVLSMYTNMEGGDGVGIENIKSVYIASRSAYDVNIYSAWKENDLEKMLFNVHITRHQPVRIVLGAQSSISFSPRHVIHLDAFSSWHIVSQKVFFKGEIKQSRLSSYGSMCMRVCLCQEMQWGANCSHSTQSIMVNIGQLTIRDMGRIIKGLSHLTKSSLFPNICKCRLEASYFIQFGMNEFYGKTKIYK